MNVGKINILVVEDEPSACKFVNLILSKSGPFIDFNVETADSLSAAIKCLGSKSFDIVLLDLGLPDSFGIDTVQKVYSANSQIPIVVLTGLSDEDKGVEAIKEGAADYLVKGKTLQHQLVRSIRYALERKQAEKALRERTHDLGERVKALTCLYWFSQLTENPNSSIDEVLSELVPLQLISPK